MNNSIFKKLTLCAVLVALLLSISVGVSAETAKLASTQNFLDYLDGKGITYTYIGLNDDGDERVKVSYSLDNFSSLACTLIFDKDEDEVDLRIWNIITVTAGKNHTYATIQKLNADYKYCKFVYDESDSSLQVEVDMFIDKDHCGKPVYDAMRYMFLVVDDNDVAEIIHSLE